ncbi:MAG: hypothetical protein GY847_33025 [Proteobacteria bacterium]|nr:hypothetical protein [Pseudomonadota bacterium]
MEPSFQVHELWLDVAVHTMFVVAQVRNFDAKNDQKNAANVPVAQMSWLSDPHHAETQKDETVDDEVLLLYHLIGQCHHTAADQKNAN